ncbi:MAG: DUF1624 domain-containing protein, partial [Methylobacteriaceae bacterium]|nr:DUF1624 domain-containing protein [Methylobacteriaceae bacterium]
MARTIEIRHTPAPPKRLDAVDVARGVAIAAMVVYHFVWDLRFVGLIEDNLATTAPMRVFSHVIAASFLIIAGASMALAHRGRFSPKAFRGHFAKVALAAAAVTIVTAYATPQAPVTFGILHAIAVGVLVCAPLARTHWAAATAVAAVLIVLPFIWRASLFDDPLLQWTGLGLQTPLTF